MSLNIQHYTIRQSRKKNTLHSLVLWPRVSLAKDIDEEIRSAENKQIFYLRVGSFLEHLIIRVTEHFLDIR